MSVENDVRSKPKERTRLQKFKKRITEALSSLTCCIPWRRNKVAPFGEQQNTLAREIEEAVKEPAVEDDQVTEVAAKISAGVASPESSGEVAGTNKDDLADGINSLTKSEDDIAELAVELAIKASLSSALDDLL